MERWPEPPELAGRKGLPNKSLRKRHTPAPTLILDSGPRPVRTDLCCFCDGLLHLSQEAPTPLSHKESRPISCSALLLLVLQPTRRHQAFPTAAWYLAAWIDGGLFISPDDVGIALATILCIESSALAFCLSQRGCRVWV